MAQTQWDIRYVWYSPLNFIFRHQFSKLEYWQPFEALAEKFENTVHISKILCTTDVSDKTDFWIQIFFCSGPFLIFLQIWWIEKMPQGKKIVNIKNQFLHARQPREGIFDIRSHRCRIFTITCQSFKWLPVFQFWELMSKNEI